MSAVTNALPPDQVRASDVDRKAVQERLHQAHANGEIDLAEFDIRVRNAWQAKSRGELDRIVADLPPIRTGKPPVRQGGGYVAMRVLTTIWLSLSVANLVIWGILELTLDAEIYPWWLWVTIPPGSVLAVLWALGIGRPKRP
jgi:Domain of unknown function (DUF1707)